MVTVHLKQELILPAYSIPSLGTFPSTMTSTALIAVSSFLATAERMDTVYSQWEYCFNTTDRRVRPGRS